MLDNTSRMTCVTEIYYARDNRGNKENNQGKR